MAAEVGNSKGESHSSKFLQCIKKVIQNNRIEHTHVLLQLFVMDWLTAKKGATSKTIRPTKMVGKQVKAVKLNALRAQKLAVASKIRASSENTATALQCRVLENIWINKREQMSIQDCEAYHELLQGPAASVPSKISAFHHHETGSLSSKYMQRIVFL